jgi:hypothetical protein
MAQMSNSATGVPKEGLEKHVRFSYTEAVEMGQCMVTSTASGTWDPDENKSLPTGGSDLVIRADCACGATAIAVTVSGTDPDGSAITGTATLPARATRDTAVDVTQSSGKKFKTITNVVPVGGTAGDKFDVAYLPTEAQYEAELGWCTNIDWQTGDTMRPVPKGYEGSYLYKRQRSGNGLTLSGLYINNRTELSRLKEQEVTLCLDVYDDGGGTNSERTVLSKVRLGVDESWPETGNVAQTATGGFRKKYVFSGSSPAAAL